MACTSASVRLATASLGGREVARVKNCCFLLDGGEVSLWVLQEAAIFNDSDHSFSLDWKLCQKRGEQQTQTSLSSQPCPAAWGWVLWGSAYISVTRCLLRCFPLDAELFKPSHWLPRTRIPHCPGCWGGTCRQVNRQHPRWALVLWQARCQLSLTSCDLARDIFSTGSKRHHVIWGRLVQLNLANVDPWNQDTSISPFVQEQQRLVEGLVVVLQHLMYMYT